MTKLVYLTGKSRAGKDEFAKFWIKYCPSFIKLAFADEIKAMTSKILGIQREDLDNSETKEKYRQFLIFGGQLGREIDKDFWANKLSEKFRYRKHFIISDLRFRNECKNIENSMSYYGEDKPIISIRIRASEENRIARGANPLFFSDISETDMDSIDDDKFDYTVINDGTLLDLEELVKEVINSENLTCVEK